MDTRSLRKNREREREGEGEEGRERRGGGGRLEGERGVPVGILFHPLCVFSESGEVVVPNHVHTGGYSYVCTLALSLSLSLT